MGVDGVVAGAVPLVQRDVGESLRQALAHLRIEDVVVDAAAGGQGIGTALIEAMIMRARELGCTTVDLTSRPSREAANRLYRRIGFEQRETNIYRFTFEAT